MIQIRTLSLWDIYFLPRFLRRYKQLLNHSIKSISEMILLGNWSYVKGLIQILLHYKDLTYKKHKIVELLALPLLGQRYTASNLST